MGVSGSGSWLCLIVGVGLSTMNNEMIIKVPSRSPHHSQFPFPLINPTGSLHYLYYSYWYFGIWRVMTNGSIDYWPRPIIAVPWGLDSINCGLQSHHDNLNKMVDYDNLNWLILILKCRDILFNVVILIFYLGRVRNFVENTSKKQTRHKC